jgi:hypothetical protein
MRRRLVTWTYDRRRRVVTLWLAAVEGTGATASVGGTTTIIDDSEQTAPGWACSSAVS